LPELKNIICDIDGCLLKSNTLIEGADKFLGKIKEQGNPLVLLTNYPSQTPSDLHNRLSSAGADVPLDCFYTSAMATAAFLERQKGNKAFVIGEGALTHELYKIGFTMTDINPDFVIVGETKSYNWDMIKKAARFVDSGARFVATNPDVTGPGMSPACGALCAPIERMTGRRPFYVGKPNAWIMRAALNNIDAHSENTIIVGDNLETDIMAGIQAGIETVLVLSGVSTRADIERMPYRPNHIFNNVGDIDFI